MSLERLEDRLQAMRAEGRRGLAPYLTAGDGGLETTLAALRALEAAGCACVELGVPFSDPVADGPVLQEAAGRALEAGTDLDGILSMLREYRSGSRGHPPGEMPVAVMSYANPLLRRGWMEACHALAEAGADAVLVADLPVEEGGPLREAALEAGLAPVFFISPTTSERRGRAAAEASRGFLYLIGRTGVTGSATHFDETTRAFLARVRGWTGLPLAVGFGIRDPEGMREALAHADLAIVGTALVQRMHEAARAEPGAFVEAAAAAAGAFARELLEALPA